MPRQPICDWKSPTAGLSIDPTNGLTGGTALPLTYVSNGLSGALAAKYPHLANLQVFSLGNAPASLKDILKAQVAVGIKKSTGEPLDATSVQTYGVLDATYAANAKSVALGATWAGGA
ncbi:MAG TPA: hypothetical protein VND93_09965, partial [Myxococcales bacterium]|nr:hypothetical protein [Myxococcales bacterium]